VGGRSQAIAMQGTAHLNQAMARPDHKDQGKSPDLVTVHPKGQTITACHHKDQVIMVAPPLKDHKNPLLEVVDQAPGLVALSQVDQHQSQGNSLVLPACSRCSQPPTLPQQRHRLVADPAHSTLGLPALTPTGRPQQEMCRWLPRCRLKTAMDHHRHSQLLGEKTRMAPH